jgi:hypothetical protein
MDCDDVERDRLSWSGEGLSFDGRTSYGAPTSSARTTRDRGEGVRSAPAVPCNVHRLSGRAMLQEQRRDLGALDAIVASKRDPDPPWRFRTIDIGWVVGGTVDLRQAERAIER